MSDTQAPPMDRTDWLLSQAAETLERAQRLLEDIAELVDTLAHPDLAPSTDAPAYYPERMSYLSELRVGDRVLFAGGWREVATWSEGCGCDPGEVRVTFTDPDMDALVDKGTHAIRIQKRADEQQADALHRRDNGGL